MTSKRSRKGNAGRRRGGYNGNSQDRIRMRGHHLMVFPSMPDPSGASQFAVHPSPGGIGGTRFVDLNVIYSQYKWINMKFTFLASGTSATPSVLAGAVTMGIIPNAANISVPVNARDIMELDHSVLSFQGQSVVSSLKIPPSLLHGEQDYYDTDSSGGFQVPCHGLIAATDALGVAIEAEILVRVDWEIEYYGRKPGNIVLKSLEQQLREGATSPAPDTFEMISSLQRNGSCSNLWVGDSNPPLPGRPNPVRGGRGKPP